MKSIEAYQTADGRLFESEKAAVDHENNLIGCELESLFDLFNRNMAVGHQSIIKNKAELSKICYNIVNIIDRE